jgi:hypothetical protein
VVNSNQDKQWLYSTQLIVIGGLPVSVATAQEVGSSLCANFRTLIRTECAKERHTVLRLMEYEPPPPDAGILSQPKRKVYTDSIFSNTSDTGCYLPAYFVTERDQVSYFL